ncbi:ABC transporter permease [Chryseolinea lacunae]|uniref:ABC transporter permease n=1 Tax=Chryseolinea lacunae TaxID=2801331 RepID=A0ABS1KNW1_9BACT|nr:ABC transporter permease [Chryseolinea lacunae]MBL0741160.1 ABC transporter permease [Chryseolinea lacunae]
MENPHLPKWIVVMLRWICPADLFEMIEGDLIEQFNIDRQRFGPAPARRKAILHALDFVRLGILARNSMPSFNAPIASHFFRFFFRGIKKHAGYSFINISGLALGLATVLLMMIYVFDEYRYDRSYQDSEKIFRIVSKIDMGGEVLYTSFSPNALSDAIKHDYPQIEYITRASLFGMSQSLAFEKSEVSAEGIAADQAFFNIFSFQCLAGNLATALEPSNPASIVITKDLAIKLFGQYHDVVGKVLKDGRRVSAVIENVANTSHIHFDFVTAFMPYTPEMAIWGNFGSYHYVKFKDTRNVPDVQSSLQALMVNRLSADPRTAGFKGTLRFQPLTSIHLDEISYSMEPSGKGNKQYAIIFTVLAVFILSIACINFTNLATVRGIRRAKEIGVRKTIGAVRIQLVMQLLGESMIAATIAMGIALTLATLALGPFNTLTQKHITFDFQSFGVPLLISFGAMVLSGILSGLYPAFVLSSVKASSLIKGIPSVNMGGGYLSKSLVVLQFTFSIMIVSGTLVVYSQLHYIRNKNLGYQRENIIRIHNGSKKYALFKTELLTHAGIKSICAADQDLTQVFGAGGVDWPGRTSSGPVLVHSIAVDPDFLETMKISLVKGRNFNPDGKLDTAALLVNEEAARLFAVDDPIGLPIRGINKSGATVVGVVQDFHFKSIHEKVAPILIQRRNNEFFYNNIMVRVEGDMQQNIATIEKTWKQFNTEDTFAYSFIDDDFASLYRTEEVTETLFKVFAGLGIIIACLGLFGLSSFTVEMKSKEYSIRKVLGASSSSLFYSSSMNHLTLVLIATLVAGPLAYYFAAQWLGTFAYHAPLSMSPFVIAGSISILLAFATVAYQSVRVALTKPNEILRAE